MRKRKFYDAVAIRVRVRSLEAISPEMKNRSSEVNQ